MTNLKKSIQEVVKELFQIELDDVVLEFPKELSFGDIALPIAMQLSKQVKKNPREVAQAIVDALVGRKLSEIIKLEIAGPGFINITCSVEYLLHQVNEGFKELQQENKDKKILLEYGAENIAKSMTVGHLRSNIIGQACANMYRALGWWVTTDNHLGDWGLQFGKLIVAYRLWGNKEVIEQDPINELVKLYVRFHEEEDKDTTLTDKAREEFAKLEKGDEESKNLWQWFYHESMKEFHELHNILGIHHDTELGESFYSPWLHHIVELCKEKGITKTADDGAVYVDFGKEKPPFYILKKDGSTLYSTRDIATIEWRLTEYPGLNRMVYFVDYSQKLHFDSLFATAKMLGLYCDFTLAYFGLVRLPEGKMSTRKGNVVYLRQLIAEGIARAHQVLLEKGVDLPETEKDALAKMIALGAIKFGDLVHNRTGDITFTWETAINFEGDTATYLQYTHARIKSVLRKGEYQEVANIKPGYTLPLEHQLLSLLSRFPIVIARAADGYTPHILAQYLLEIAALFNQFYNDVPVIRAESEELRAERLYLVAQVAKVLKVGLALLGIDVPEKM
ncbi:MAG: arginine--tRNA ligase [Candidatus Abawacabacteria bacterium]|nr:arginine--tRNA ligase [Candidatus Abawacabacteria bacterium]